MNSRTNFLTTPIAVLVGAGLISLSILISGGVIKFKKPSTPQTTVLGQTNPTIAPQVPNQPPPEPQGPVKVSVDDDPVLGLNDAPITLIEFSDYECPFCKRHFDQTFSQLKKDYIDTGKVRLVYRDLPLSFHDPNATNQAMAANCARDQGGDTTYFKYHDEVFKRTTSNKTFSDENLPKIAQDLGLNVSNFESCLSGKKYEDEVKKDLADASTAGASGTPTFFIGKSSKDGTIDGTRIVGAQPYSAFQAIIDSLLK